jgi:hypothetical protein
METDAAADRLRLLECARDLALMMGAAREKAESVNKPLPEAVRVLAETGKPFVPLDAALLGPSPDPRHVDAVGIVRAWSNELRGLAAEIRQGCETLRENPGWQTVPLYRWAGVRPEGEEGDAITLPFGDPAEAVEALATVFADDIDEWTGCVADAPPCVRLIIGRKAGAEAESFNDRLSAYPPELFVRLAAWCDASRGEKPKGERATSVATTTVVPVVLPLAPSGEQILESLGWWREPETLLAFVGAAKSVAKLTEDLMRLRRIERSVNQGGSPCRLSAKLYELFAVREAESADATVRTWCESWEATCSAARKAFGPLVAQLPARLDSPLAASDPDQFVNDIASRIDQTIPRLIDALEAVRSDHDGDGRPKSSETKKKTRKINDDVRLKLLRHLETHGDGTIAASVLIRSFLEKHAKKLRLDATCVKTFNNLQQAASEHRDKWNAPPKRERNRSRKP